MAECLVCGKQFDPLQGRHVCAGNAVHVSGYVQEVTGPGESYACRNCGLVPAFWSTPHHPHARFCSEQCLTEIDERLGVPPPPDCQPAVLSGTGGAWAVPAEDSEALPSVGAAPHSVWTTFAGHHLCGDFFIARTELPADRQAMRQLLHVRLQAFGDALMEEWEKLIHQVEPLTEAEIATLQAQSPYTDVPEQYSLSPPPSPGKGVS